MKLLGNHKALAKCKKKVLGKMRFFDGLGGGLWYVNTLGFLHIAALVRTKMMALIGLGAMSLGERNEQL